MMRRAVIAVVALTVLLAGCGAYTKQDFVARADAICASTVRKTRSISAPAVARTKAEQRATLAGYLSLVAPIVKSEASQIDALQRPTQDRAALTRYLAALTQVATDYEALATAARRGDSQAVANTEAALRTSPVTALAADYGLPACEAPGATVR